MNHFARMAVINGGLAIALVGLFVDKTTAEDPPQEGTIQSGGAQSPPGGGRPDAQEPQLGTGNRGTGQRGSAGASSLDPGVIRSETTGPARVTGQVLKINDDSYVIRDPSGNEIVLRIDADTAIDGLINMGAKVEAEVEADGRITRLKKK